jgi:Tfp pilus assembly protein PilF
MSELAHGLLLQEQGRFEEAESCFRSALIREPENDLVYGRLALCLISMPGRKKEALESIESAIRLRADEPLYHGVKSLVLVELRRGKGALEAADQALALNPADAFSLASKANAYCSMDRWAEGEEWSRKALKIDSDNAMAANLLTHTLRLQGKSSESTTAVEQLLADDPENSFVHVNAGWSALQQGQPKNAEEHFREALRLDPDSDMAREGLLESFRARSCFYRGYLAYTFFMQRFTGGKQWAIIIGIYVVYRFAVELMESFSSLVAGALVLLWLALVMWVWLAPGVGNFLIFLDRNARLALKTGERLQGIVVGGGISLGVVGLVGGLVSGYEPIFFAGIGLVVSTLPASLSFGNESKVGRRVFGSITAFVYLTTVIVTMVEAFQYPSDNWHQITVWVGSAALVSVILSTWLGNVRALRQASVS